MDWLTLAQQHEQQLIDELRALIQIESVLDETQASASQPFGPGPRAALQYMLDRGEAEQMVTKNVDNMAGHIEMGQGEDIVGILCHVDVVPAGDRATWTYPPFEGVLADGKLYGRGAIDDKGPTIAAWMAMKLVKQSGIRLNKRVRMIIGSDEESGFRCVDRYFAREEMPSIGFAPDADFPLINAEKGIASLLFTQKQKRTADEQLITFTAGERMNMVPEKATAAVAFIGEATLQNFHNFLAENNATGTFTEQGGHYIMTVNGKSAHAMEPEKGRNAAVLLAHFLCNELTTPVSQQFAQFVVDVFAGDHFGTALGLHYRDDMSGDTTLNPGIVTFDEQGGTLQISMRYAVTYPYEEKITAAQQAMQAYPFTLDITGNSKPHYVPEDDTLVQTLMQAYEKYSGDTSRPLSTGGGTYARVMKKGVAFGMVFPGEPDVAHQADECVVVANLVKAAAIYAEAIVQLAANE